ncbi:polysaccharide lyase [Streptomyces sp. McG3]|uniref:polysaccharide lyase n=1 Tax=Streptomyces sp. McG3 TaxID=2725483 RepID=UPI001BE6310A|nr:polysaccharide lyase [Streptomyces sp. McG3]MBT2896677.1 hypothetical protein [Streptomyces sp. McG3]
MKFTRSTAAHHGNRRRPSRRTRLICTTALVAGATALTPVAFGAATAPAAPSALPSSCTAPVNGRTVFSDGFEGSAENFNFVKHRYDGAEAGSSITAATSPALAGKQSGRFTVPGDGKSWRAEVANDAMGYGAYRFSFSNYLPADWERTNFDTVVAQWHGKPLSDGSNTNPPIALSVRNSEWLLSVFHLENPTDTKPVRREYRLGTVSLGRWNNWTFDIDWSTAGHAGALRVCRDGRQLVNDSGENNFHQPKEPYFKVGIYRPSWNPAKGRDFPIGVSVATVHIDSVTVTDLD